MYSWMTGNRFTGTLIRETPGNMNTFLLKGFLPLYFLGGFQNQATREPNNKGSFKIPKLSSAFLVKILWPTHSGTQQQRTCLVFSLAMAQWCITLPYHWNKYMTAWAHQLVTCRCWSLMISDHPYVEFKQIKASNWPCAILNVQIQAIMQCSEIPKSWNWREVQALS